MRKRATNRMPVLTAGIAAAAVIVGFLGIGNAWLGAEFNLVAVFLLAALVGALAYWSVAPAKRVADPLSPPSSPEVTALLPAVLTGLCFLVLLWMLDDDATLALIVVPSFMGIFVYLLHREMEYRRDGIVDFAFPRLTADAFLWGCVIAGIGAGAVRVALSPELWVRRELIFLGVASLVLIMVADAVSWLMRRQRMRLAGAEPE